MGPERKRYLDFFCFLAARFSFRFFLGCFFSDLPPLSLLATCPPEVAVRTCILLKEIQAQVAKESFAFRFPSGRGMVAFLIPQEAECARHRVTG